MKLWHTGAVVALGFAMIFGTGCVSAARYQRDLKNVTDIAFKAVEVSKELREKHAELCEAEQTMLMRELGQKNDRLRAFNQLNPDGSLRSK